MATSGRGRRPSDELRQPYRLTEGSRPREMASRSGYSNALAGVGYEESEERLFTALSFNFLNKPGCLHA